MPSPNLNHALDSLTRGRWLFDDLAPPFGDALIERLKGKFPPAELKGLPLYQLTALAYGVVSGVPGAEGARAGLLLRTIPRARSDFWRKVIRHFDKRRRHRAPSEREARLVGRALVSLREASPDSYEVFRTWIKKICPLDGREFHGGSHPHVFGCLFFDEQLFDEDARHVAVSLVHETAHQELFLVNLYDRLAAPGQESSVKYSPFQRRERPLIGRLHSAHALFRMILYRREAGLDNGEDERLLRETLGTFEPDELTPFAARLVKKVYAKL